MDSLRQAYKKFSKLIFAGVGLVVLMIAYNILYLQPKKEAEADFIRSENQSITSSELGREIISTLNRLKTINIDPEFFQDDRFRRLIDFSVEIQPQPVGKENPFREVDLFNLGGAGEQISDTGVLDDVEETGTPGDQTAPGA